MYEVLFCLCVITLYVTDESFAIPLSQTRVIEMPYLNFSNNSNVESRLETFLNTEVIKVVTPCNTSKITCATLVHCQKS